MRFEHGCRGGHRLDGGKFCLQGTLERVGSITDCHSMGEGKGEGERKRRREVPLASSG